MDPGKRMLERKRARDHRVTEEVGGEVGGRGGGSVGAEELAGSRWKRFSE